MSKQLEVGDKVTFRQGFGTIIDKRATAYAYEYDVRLDLAFQTVTELGYTDDQSQRGAVYTTQYCQLDND
jgi:hypothetical protein